MRLSAILMSRVIAIPALGETNPFGRVFVAPVLPALGERYKFQKVPTIAEAIEAQKNGVILEYGYSEDCGSIRKLTIHQDGMTLESRSHSSQAQKALVNMYRWLSQEFGLHYDDNTVKRWLYVTDLAFYAETNLLDLLSPVLRPICDAMTAYNLTLGRPTIPFSTTRVAIDYDRSVLDFPQTSFLIEREKGAKFGENKYFSESPFPSERHLEILEEFEQGLLRYAGRQEQI